MRCRCGAVTAPRFPFYTWITTNFCRLLPATKLTIRCDLGIFWGSVKIVYSQVYVKKSSYVGVTRGKCAIRQKNWRRKKINPGMCVTIRLEGGNR